MLEVYTTEKAIETLVGSKHNMPKWDKILRSDSCVRVFVDTDEETLDQLMLDNDIDLEIDEDGVIEKMKNCNDVVLEYPVAAFFPSLKKKDAESIQSRYGVICQGDNDIKDDDTLSSIHNRPAYLGKKHSWDDILSVLKSFPSNAILINDQYLFSKGSERKDGKVDFSGLKNLRNILDMLLPPTFEDRAAYHVIIVVNEESVKYKTFAGRLEKKYPFDKLSKLVKDEIRSLRNYKTPIQVEVLSVCKEKNTIKECGLVHDRYILTNYALIDCTHAFDAFDNQGEAYYRQDVNINSIFGTGIEDDSDIPEEKAFDYRKCFHNYKFERSTYTINSKQTAFNGIENRLISKIPNNRAETVRY